jgi:hypothetical protein
MNEIQAKGVHFLPNGLAFLLMNLLLGFCMTVGSVLYQRNPDPACHGAGLSAGFPLPFICDDSAGSPISSWGKIDLADISNVNPRVFLLDFLLYNALVSLVLSTAISIFRKGTSKVEISRWAVLLCVTFILAFLFAFLSFQSDYLNFDIPIPRTPTPIIYTPTPFGTPAPTLMAPTSSLP